MRNSYIVHLPLHELAVRSSTAIVVRERQVPDDVIHSEMLYLILCHFRYPFQVVLSTCKME